VDELEIESPESSGFNRRTVLKGAAVGTALWAAPSVTSLATRASAASNNGFCTCDKSNENSFCLCGTSGPLGDCFCADDTEGTPRCNEDIFCADTVPCQQSSDCGPGQHCLEPSNGCGQSVCVDPCGTHPARPHGAAKPNMNRARAGKR
jgi:hypothetical protein